MHDKIVGAFITFVIGMLVFVIVLPMVPISNDIVTESLVANSIIQDLNVKDSENFSFKEKTDDGMKLKNIKYKGDVKYIKSSSNKISYKVWKNIYGRILKYEDVIVEYVDERN